MSSSENVVGNADQMRPRDTKGGADGGSEDLRALIAKAIADKEEALLITSVGEGRDRIVYVNPAVTRQTGYQQHDVIGNPLQMFHGPDTSQAIGDHIRSAVDARGPVRRELVATRKNGTAYWTEIDITPIHDDDGKATHLVAVYRDLTEQKNIREKLQRNDQRMQSAIAAIADVIWEWTIGTDQFTYRDDISESAWLGRHHGTTRGTGPDPLLDLIHPDDRDRIQQSLMAQVAGSEHFHISEYRFRRPDGSHAKVKDLQFVLRDAAGRAERIIGSLLDVSENRARDDRRQKSQRLEVLGDVTGGIAHNFNNLLTVILGNIDRLRDDQIDDSQFRQTVGMIDDAAQRGARLTQSLISFSRSRLLTLNSVDVGCLVDQVTPTWRALLPSGIRLVVRSDPALWPARTDEVQLESVIMSLVINARDAMPDGGELLIETANIGPGSDQVRADDNDQSSSFVTIKVTDTGIGMTAEAMKAAFEPFFTTKPPGQGAGLNLSSAHGFLKQSGGFMRLRSTPGKGSTVCIFLKAASAPVAPEPVPGPRRDHTAGDYTVLAVDDDPLLRAFVRNLISALGYKLIIAASGEEALRVLGTGIKVDLLFTDIVLADGMNGWELACRVGTSFPGLPVLFTSGYPDAAGPPQGETTRKIRILRKPYRARDLSAAILEALEAAPPRVRSD